MSEVRPQRVPKVIDSLAVLPFENTSGDPEREYLSDGITGSLINTLATVPKLRVMAQSTVLRYKDREIDPQAVGRELTEFAARVRSAEAKEAFSAFLEKRPPDFSRATQSTAQPVL